MPRKDLGLGVIVPPLQIEHPVLDSRNPGTGSSGLRRTAPRFGVITHRALRRMRNAMEHRGEPSPGS